MNARRLIASGCVLFAVTIGATRSNQAADLLNEFKTGPMRDVNEIVFAVRKLCADGHWYTNFGYYAPDENRKAYMEGSKLCALDLNTKTTRVLLEDARGGFRDPQVHYDGGKILFSYRPGGTEHYHLYEINVDGSGLRQITSGEYEDIEPTYLPDGEIVFVSSRCNRWVNCWLTQVATLHRCDADGSNIRAISSNNEHDNTPWPLPDGRLLYTLGVCGPQPGAFPSSLVGESRRSWTGSVVREYASGHYDDRRQAGPRLAKSHRQFFAGTWPT
jgi:hypothetical protein